MQTGSMETNLTVKEVSHRPVRDSFLRVGVGVGIGGLMALAASSFLFIADSIKHFSEFIGRIASSYGNGWAVIVSPVFLLVAAFLIYGLRHTLGVKRFHGPAETIQAAQSGENVDIRIGFGSTLAALISVGGAASVGQYGPLVHLGGAIGSGVSRVLRSTISTSTWIGCGVAGAIAAGFGTPMAAIVFSHEVVLRRFSLRAVAPISIAAITASALSDQLLGGRRIQFDQVVGGSMLELLPFVIVGAPIFAVVAVVFMTLLGKLTEKVDHSWKGRIGPLILAAIVCGVVGVWVPGALGLGLDVIPDLLHNNLAVTTIVILVISKLFLTVTCIGCGMHGGVYLPSLFIGAGVGCLFGKMVAALGIAGGESLGIAGMAAVAAAVFGAPISTVLIVLEFTLSYEAAIFSIIAVTICTLITNELYGPSLFDRQISTKVD